LLGPSGCGKTTTLRIVAGLETPTQGQVLIGGQDVTGMKPHERPVNTVFQSYALFPHMSILENVAFGLRQRKVDDPVAKAQEALDLVELGHIAARRPQQLSGGQQQRVALARALVNRPSLLLLDEPLGALDLKLRRQMQIELKAIQMDVGLTFLHVTHDQEEAMDMADTVAVMNKGRIEQMGAPESLYDRPKTASFRSSWVSQTFSLARSATQTTTRFRSKSVVTKSPLTRNALKSTPAPSRLACAQRRQPSTPKSQSFRVTTSLLAKVKSSTSVLPELATSI